MTDQSTPSVTGVLNTKQLLRDEDTYARAKKLPINEGWVEIGDGETCLMLAHDQRVYIIEIPLYSIDDVAPTLEELGLTPVAPLAVHDYDAEIWQPASQVVRTQILDRG